MIFGDEGMLLELFVVTEGKIGTVVASAAFLTSERAAGDHQTEGMKIAEFVV